MKFYAHNFGSLYLELALYGLPKRISLDASIDFEWKEATLGAGIFFGAVGLVIGWDR
jgi:hypothetical protein